MNGFPKYQYSFFLQGRDSPQIVVRGDNFQDFVLDIEKAKTLLIPLRPVVAQPEVKLEPSSECPKCGSPLIMTETKTGKKIQKCSTNKWDFKLKEAVGCTYINWNV